MDTSSHKCSTSYLNSAGTFGYPSLGKMKIPLLISLLFIATWDGARATGNDRGLENVLAQFVKKGAQDWMSFFDFVKSAERKDPHKVGKVVVSTLLLEVLQKKLSETDLRPLQVLNFKVAKEDKTTTDIVTVFTARTPFRPHGTVQCEATIAATIQPPNVFSIIIPALPRFEILRERLKCNHWIVVKTEAPLDKYAHHKVSHSIPLHKLAVHSPHPLMAKRPLIHPLIKHLSSPHKVPVKHLTMLHKLSSPHKLPLKHLSTPHKVNSPHKAAVKHLSAPHKVSSPHKVLKHLHKLSPKPLAAPHKVSPLHKPVSTTHKVSPVHNVHLENLSHAPIRPHKLVGKLVKKVRRSADFFESDDVSETDDFSEVDDASESDDLNEVDDVYESDDLSEVDDVSETDDLSEVDDVSETDDLSEVDDISEIDDLSEVDDDSY